MIEKVRDSIKDIIEENGCHLENVEYVNEDGLNYLRISIGKENGIEVDDCVLVSKAISPIIDELDPIEESYILDVCSMGGDDLSE